MTALTDTDTETTDLPAARLEELTVGSLQPHPRNIRDSLGDVTDLATSIAAKGVIHPLTVVAAGAKGKYRIIAGHRRHAAAKEAKLKKVPCVIRTDLDDEADQLAVMLAENTEKADLTLVEEVNAVQGLLELDGSIVKVASRTGMSRKRVSERSRVAKLDESWKTKLTRFALSLDDALFVAKHADVPEDAEFLDRHIGTPDWGFAKQKITEKVALRKQHEKWRTEIADAGLLIVSNPAELSDWRKDHGWNMQGLSITRTEWSERDRTPAPTSAVVYWQTYEGETPVIHEYAAAVTEVVPTPDVDEPVREDIDTETPPAEPVPDADTDVIATDAVEPDAAPAPDAAAASSPEVSPEQAERTERKADLKTAAQVRATFIADALAKGVDESAVATAIKATLAYMLDQAIVDASSLGSLLNIGDEDLGQAIESATSLPWLAMVMALSENGMAEHQALEAGYGCDSNTLAWSQVFDEMGYTWSTVEQALLKETFDSVALADQE